MKATEMKNPNSTNEKSKTNGEASKGRVRPSSAAGANGDLSNAVAGFIESDRFTVCGGLMALCCGPRWGNHCVFRTSARHLIAIVNSVHCKWCKEAASTPVQESDFDDIKTRAYLRALFQLKLSDAVKLSELISELKCTQTDGDGRGLPFTGTPPYCTVENVTHISSLALKKLIEFDKEFVWGDNLIFNTKAERSESGSR